MIYYYPPMLPREMMVDKVKTGELDPNIWVALEDIHDGWEQSGSVGQEVYGAGLAFGIVPRQYIKIPNQEFMVFVDYPILNQKIKGKTLNFNISGDSRLTCKLRILKQSSKRLPKIKVKVNKADDQELINTAKQDKEGFEYVLHGDQQVSITWS
ncbi:hypothetical protein [Mucilaginibacter antarcticus]